MADTRSQAGEEGVHVNVILRCRWVLLLLLGRHHDDVLQTFLRRSSAPSSEVHA